MAYRLVGNTTPNEVSTTGALDGQISVVIKRDTDDAPAGQVYSELAANRLAQFLGIPVALGVAALDPADVAIARYASLRAADDSMEDFTQPEPEQDDDDAPVGTYTIDGYSRQYRRLCQRFPMEASYLAVFDLWIGNADRSFNLKAHLVEGSPRVLFAIDHGSSLLGCAKSVKRAFEKLADTQQPSFHVLQKLVHPVYCGEMIERIRGMPEWALESATIFEEQIGSVLPSDQYSLLDRLIERRKSLRAMVDAVLL